LHNLTLIPFTLCVLLPLWHLMLRNLKCNVDYIFSWSFKILGFVCTLTYSSSTTECSLLSYYTLVSHE
jgi:hypothetical protein